ncbi:BON domain-containing protein [Granulicella sp. WH15]|uniref:BON domain-containing protein n=1 Tax=Granulicella sp. WH15 TaxID=2602070 RepID=UPI0013669C60|nr:BON domain-containing protein [Granulicella sp. WH15]QHN04914.1 BON domain-containing protein [Granulicella sp. WH15]
MFKLERLLASPATALLTGVLGATLLLGLAGCKAKPAPADDNALAASVQSQLAADTSLAGLPIQSSVQSGIAILSGSVNNDAQRQLAIRDASAVAGIKTVVNNLTIQPAAAAATPPPAPVPVPAPKPVPVKPSAAVKTPVRPAPEPKPRPAPIERSAAIPPPPPVAPVVAAPPPPPPPQPTFKNVTLTAGTTIPIRITQTLDSATTQQGDAFSGVVASDIVVDGIVAIPQGAPVSGRVDAVQEAAHFKGSSLLTVSLASVRRMSVSTEPYTVEGKGRGKNTATKAGIGAVGGAILGGIFGGGKGAAIGAAAGGGVGAGSNAITRGEQVQIPSESIVRFRTTTPLTVRVQLGGGHDDGDHRRNLPE